MENANIILTISGKQYRCGNNFLPFLPIFRFIFVAGMSDENFSLTSLAHKMRETEKNIHTIQKCINKNSAYMKNHVCY